MSETDVDTVALESYLSRELGERVVGTEVLDDGLNLMVAISTETEGTAYVLRRPNKLRRTSLFNDLEREYGLLQRLQGTEIPVPTPVVFCEDESIVGDSFFLSTYVQGEAFPRGRDLPARFQNPASRELVATRTVETLAEIHSLDPGRFADVCEEKTALEQVAQATERLDEATDVTGHEVPTLRAVADWLRENAPSSTPGPTLVHGDFRPGNVFFAGADRPVITGVLDWETAMLGDPLTELGYFLLDWRNHDDPELSLDELEARYGDVEAIREVRAMNENGLSPFTANPGAPSRRELVRRYVDATDIEFENGRFYRAHGAFMLATVWLDLYRHEVAAGVESDRRPYVDYMAMVADSIASGEFEL